MIDWSRCPDVESVPGRCGGAWVAKDSRVMVEGILENAEDASPEEVAEMFQLPVEQVRRILAFVAPGGTTAAMADPDTIYIDPICDRCNHYATERFWRDVEDDAGCAQKDCPNKPVVYIRADLFDAEVMRMEKNMLAYIDERELFISQLESLLIRAREATDDHELYSDIGEALPNLRPAPIKSDLARIDRMKDSDIDYSDIPELGDEFFAKARHPTGPREP